MIPYGRQDVTEADIAAVVRVLRSDFLTQGEVVPEFEAAIAGYSGAKHAVAANSATSALHMACMALGLGPGDWLWTSPITFVASANCALYCGASVDFVDVDPRTSNMSVSCLEDKLIEADREGRLPKIVVPVHMGGQSCDMARIQELAVRYGFRIIEDASHAIGGRYRDEAVGSCRYSDITVFSFHPVKIITTAEGGMALTNQPRLAEAMSLGRSHGITRDPARMTRESDGPWYYQQISLGYNYRLTEIQAALGLSQAGRITEYVERRHAIAKRYAQLLAGMPVDLPWQHPDAHSAFHLYVVRLQLNNIKRTHREVFDFLRDAGIGVNVHYIPVHTQPYFKARSAGTGKYPEAERYYAEAISLPMFATLDGGQQDRVAEALGRATSS